MTKKELLTALIGLPDESEIILKGFNDGYFSNLSVVAELDGKNILLLSTHRKELINESLGYPVESFEVFYSCHGYYITKKTTDLLSSTTAYLQKIYNGVPTFAPDYINAKFYHNKNIACAVCDKLKRSTQAATKKERKA